MGSGWHEWPLVIFTVFGQCVAGALIVMGFVWLKENDDKARMRIVRSLFFLWLVMGIGFMASVLHLGSPLRAFNSLNRVGASALSNGSRRVRSSLPWAVSGGWCRLSVKCPSFGQNLAGCQPDHGHRFCLGDDPGLSD